MSEDTAVITELKALIDVLADLEVTPESIQLQDPSALGLRPRITVSGLDRTSFEALTARLGIEPREDLYGRHDPHTRSWWAHRSTDSHELHIQAISYSHHPDWEPKESTR